MLRHPQMVRQTPLTDPLEIHQAVCLKPLPDGASFEWFHSCHTAPCLDHLPGIQKASENGKTDQLYQLLR